MIADRHRRQLQKRHPGDQTRTEQGRPTKSPRCSAASLRAATTLGNADGARDAPVLRRPRVPDLQGIHARRAADAHPEVGAHRQAARSNTTRWRQRRANPKSSRPSRSRRCAAGKQNKMWNFIETFYHEQGEEDSGYVTEKYLQGIASAGPRAEPRRSGPPTAAIRHSQNEVEHRRAGRQQRRLHRHALVPDRQDRRHAEEARIRSLTRRPDASSTKAIEKLLKS